jgi:hypothetical protein
MNKIQKIQKIKKLMVISILLLLAGCTTMNSKFDCPNRPGITCKSIDQVNDMVDRGLIGKDPQVKNNRLLKVYSLKNSSNIANRFSQANLLRSGEQVVRVWIGPYQDIHSNYHNESTLYVVVRKNNWAVPKEVREQI